MVQLLLIPPSGSNLGTRYFRYTGCFGLTPCVVTGTVRVKHDADPRPLQAKSLTVAVKCYESRLGPVNPSYSNILVDLSVILWSKPVHLSAARIAEADYPFKIIIPPDSPGFSTANFQEYKVSWRVEAILEHPPISGVGSRLLKHLELPLVRYDVASISPLRSLLPDTSADIHSAKLRASVLRYNLSTPTSPIGPEDLVSVYINIHHLDSLASIRYASLIIERRLNLHSSQSSAQNQPLSYPTIEHQDYTHPSPDILPSPSSFTAVPASPTASLSSVSDLNGSLIRRPLLRSRVSHSPSVQNSTSTELSKAITNTIVSTEAFDFFRDSNGMWTKHITVQWPSRKKFTWSTGETLSSEMATIRFYIRVRLHILSSISGAESIELDERELIVASTNESDCRLGLAQFNELQPRSGSKSPRRRSRLQDPEHLPPQSQNLSSRHAHRQGSSTQAKLKTPRRPHTSAGPRDTSNLPYSVQAEAPINAPIVKPHAFPSSRGNAGTLGFRGEFISHSHTSEDHSKQGHNKSRIPSDHIRDWEAELARIESQSRRSSADMLGSWGGRRQNKDQIHR